MPKPTFLLPNLDRDATVVSTIAITQFDYYRCCISLNGDIIKMNQGTETFLKNKNKHVPFQERFFYRHSNVFLMNIVIVYQSKAKNVLQLCSVHSNNSSRDEGNLTQSCYRFYMYYAFARLPHQRQVEYVENKAYGT